jgi:predicted DNA-binding protein
MKKRERGKGILIRVDHETYRTLRMLAAKDATMVAPYIRDLIMKHIARKGAV